MTQTGVVRNRFDLSKVDGWQVGHIVYTLSYVGMISIMTSLNMLARDYTLPVAVGLVTFVGVVLALGLFLADELAATGPVPFVVSQMIIAVACLGIYKVDLPYLLGYLVGEKAQISEMTEKLDSLRPRMEAMQTRVAALSGVEGRLTAARATICTAAANEKKGSLTGVQGEGPLVRALDAICAVMDEAVKATAKQVKGISTAKDVALTREKELRARLASSMDATKQAAFYSDLVALNGKIGAVVQLNPGEVTALFQMVNNQLDAAPLPPKNTEAYKQAIGALKASADGALAALLAAVDDARKPLPESPDMAPLTLPQAIAKHGWDYTDVVTQIYVLAFAPPVSSPYIWKLLPLWLRRRKRTPEEIEADREKTRQHKVTSSTNARNHKKVMRKLRGLPDVENVHTDGLFWAAVHGVQRAWRAVARKGVPVASAPDTSEEAASAAPQEAVVLALPAPQKPREPRPAAETPEVVVTPPPAKPKAETPKGPVQTWEPSPIGRDTLTAPEPETAAGDAETEASQGLRDRIASLVRKLVPKGGDATGATAPVAETPKPATPGDGVHRGAPEAEAPKPHRPVTAGESAAAAMGRRGTADSFESSGLPASSLGERLRAQADERRLAEVAELLRAMEAAQSEEERRRAALAKGGEPAGNDLVIPPFLRDGRQSDAARPPVSEEPPVDPRTYLQEQVRLRGVNIHRELDGPALKAWAKENAAGVQELIDLLEKFRNAPVESVAGANFSLAELDAQLAETRVRIGLDNKPKAAAE